MASTKRLTSITEDKAKAFVRNAAERETLACSFISGFHLMKTKTGASWRLRYTGLNGQGKHARKVATIGAFPSMMPKDAATVALEWRTGDPLAEAQKNKHHREEAFKRSKARSLKAYLDGLYSDYQSKKKSGKNTIGLIRSNFVHLLDRDMASITKADIRVWQKGKLDKGRAHPTLQRAYGALKTMLNHAVREDEILSENPLKEVQLMPPSADEQSKAMSAEAKAHRRLLTGKEVDGILNGLELYSEELREQRRNSRAHGKSHLIDLDTVTYAHWFIPFCHLTFHTGMRPGDLYALKWGDIDLTFRKQLRKVPEKTMHHSNPAVVVMPLSDKIQNILELWRKQGTGDGFVFPSKDGGMMDKKSHNKPWKHVLKHSGIDAPLQFYSIRHHFISKLVTDGVSLLQVAQLVGHRSVAMIEKHYGHLCPDAAIDIMAAYAQSLSNGVDSKEQQA